MLGFSICPVAGLILTGTWESNSLLFLSTAKHVPNESLRQILYFSEPKSMSSCIIQTLRMHWECRLEGPSPHSSA